MLTEEAVSDPLLAWSLLMFVVRFALVFLCFSLAACDVENLEEGELDSDVELDGIEPAEEDEQSGISTMEEYIEAYCDYAVGCTLWIDSETCIEDLSSGALATCEVLSVVDLNACADWLGTLSCADQGWIEACDNAYECN